MKLDPEIAWRITDPGPVCILATPGGPEGVRLMSAVWVMQVSFNPAILLVSIGMGKRFNRALRASGKLTVNVPTIEHLQAVRICGGKDPEIDSDQRVAKCGLTLKGRRIDECSAWIDADLMAVGSAGDHDLFYLRIIDVEVRSDCFDPHRKVWEPEVKLIRNFGAGELR